MKSSLLDATCRVAFAGLIHDLGKFAQRARIDASEASIKLHQQMYCPRRQAGDRIWWTHQHAAYTALAFPVIEKVAPALIGEKAFPFSEGDATDSLINAASAHHAPQTFLQWIVATADRVASGFEREVYDGETAGVEPKNFIQTRQRALLEEVSLQGSRSIRADTLKLGFPLRPLSAAALFPEALDKLEDRTVDQASSEYRTLWQDFASALASPDRAMLAGFRESWPLWLDSFDTAWLTFTQAVPSATAFNVKPDVSLYDHSKAVAALSAALWRWHEEEGRTDDDAVRALKNRLDWDDDKLLLIQGDFFGIQNFIFSEGSDTNRKSAKLLRGRSFYVSLLCELAALKVLQTLELPSTSQIINAAGKFLIVAPNTTSVKTKLEVLKTTFDEWFLDSTFGTCGIGLAATPATCNDFIGKHYQALADRLYLALEKAKYQRFAVTKMDSAVFDADYPYGACRWQQRMPADGRADGESCALSRDQILVGRALTTKTHLVIFDHEAPSGFTTCEMPIFGYRVAFASSDQLQRLKPEGISRCWDFSLPADPHEVLWHGCARRNINGYVPHYSQDDLLNPDARFGDDDDLVVGATKTFETLAHADTRSGLGTTGLMTLKGDVDNLGLIFRKGLTDATVGRERIMTFAKTASLSRQMNAFFSVYLPTLCAQKFRNMYTVFAGGDDFFLIGPWHETQKLALALKSAFVRFACCNPDVHFSVGMVMTKPSVPARTLAAMAEEALSEAKSRPGKCSASLFGQTVSWTDLHRLEEIEDFLSEAADRYGVTSSYLYSLFELIDMAGDTTRPEASLWRSRLYYTTTRLFERQRTVAGNDVTRARDEFLQTLLRYFERDKAALRIPLTNTFYAVRRN